jgi:hypothetical protein
MLVDTPFGLVNKGDGIMHMILTKLFQNIRPLTYK